MRLWKHYKTIHNDGGHCEDNSDAGSLQECLARGNRTYRARPFNFVNLVAKEHCACSIEEDCVLILSEYAGAAAQLQSGVLLVSAYDREGVADAIHRAFHMSLAKRRAHMRRLRRAVRKQEIFWWADSFLRASIETDMSAFPLCDFVPLSEAPVFPF